VVPSEEPAQRLWSVVVGLHGILRTLQGARLVLGLWIPIVQHVRDATRAAPVEPELRELLRMSVSQLHGLWLERLPDQLNSSIEETSGVTLDPPSERIAQLGRGSWVFRIRIQRNGCASQGGEPRIVLDVDDHIRRGALCLVVL